MHNAGTGPQPSRLFMILRGKGNVREREVDSYHPSIYVAFQDNAWLTAEGVHEFMREVVNPHLTAPPFADASSGPREGGGFLLFMDHLAAQKREDVVAGIHELGGVAAYGPKGKTEAWQPVDYGHIGACLKELARRFWDVFFDQSTLVEGMDNFTAMEQGKATMRQKRVAATHVYGQAWDAFRQKPYLNLRRRAFLGSGAMLTTSGTNDHSVEILGWDGLVEIPPPGTPWTDDAYARDCLYVAYVYVYM